jgi:hypothetical protein
MTVSLLCRNKLIQYLRTDRHTHTHTQAINPHTHTHTHTYTHTHRGNYYAYFFIMLKISDSPKLGIQNNTYLTYNITSVHK